MATQDAAVRVRQRHMEVRTIRRERPGKREDLQVAAQFGWLLGPGEPQPCHVKTANALKYKGRIDALFAQCGLECGAHVLSGSEAQRKHSHGNAKGNSTFDQVKRVTGRAAAASLSEPASPSASLNLRGQFLHVEKIARLRIAKPRNRRVTQPRHLVIKILQEELPE
jgi:hypothetical protein